MGEPTPIDKLATSKFVLDIFKFVGPVVFSILAVYGTYKASKGADEQRLVNVEVKLVELQKQLDRDREQYIPRAELNAYLAGFERTLASIERDVRAVRERGR